MQNKTLLYNLLDYIDTNTILELAPSAKPVVDMYENCSGDLLNYILQKAELIFGYDISFHTLVISDLVEVLNKDEGRFPHHHNTFADVLMLERDLAHLSFMQDCFVQTIVEQYKIPAKKFVVKFRNMSEHTRKTYDELVKIPSLNLPARILTYFQELENEGIFLENHKKFLNSFYTVADATKNIPSLIDFVCDDAKLEACGFKNLNEAIDVQKVYDVFDHLVGEIYGHLEVMGR